MVHNTIQLPYPVKSNIISLGQIWANLFKPKDVLGVSLPGGVLNPDNVFSVLYNTNTNIG